jgi:hypothetical protein
MKGCNKLLSWKVQFAKRFNLLEKEVNKMVSLKRARKEPTSAQMERYNRAKRLLNIMNKDTL